VLLLALRARQALKTRPLTLLTVGGLVALAPLIWSVNIAPDAWAATFQVSRISKAGQRGGENCQLTDKVDASAWSDGAQSRPRPEPGVLGVGAIAAASPFARVTAKKDRVYFATVFGRKYTR
jgi:hypothetical protein